MCDNNNQILKCAYQFDIKLLAKLTKFPVWTGKCGPIYNSVTLCRPLGPFNIIKNKNIYLYCTLWQCSNEIFKGCHYKCVIFLAINLKTLTLKEKFRLMQFNHITLFDPHHFPWYACCLPSWVLLHTNWEKSWVSRHPLLYWTDHFIIKVYKQTFWLNQLLHHRSD